MKEQQDYSIYSEFDLEQHKKTFRNYLEVIIHPDGTVHYAIPSHQEYLIKYACREQACSRETLYNSCPKEYYFDVSTWLCKITKCVSVWSGGIQHYGAYEDLTDSQKATIKLLVENNLTSL